MSLCSNCIDYNPDTNMCDPCGEEAGEAVKYCDERRSNGYIDKKMLLRSIISTQCEHVGIGEDLEYAHYELMYQYIRNAPVAEDVESVVRCKDCIYWQKPQIRLSDGTYRDYKEYEEFQLVDSSVGINIGSYCNLYNRDHKNDIPQFMGKDDFCSKGYRKDG